MALIRAFGFSLACLLLWAPSWPGFGVLGLPVYRVSDSLNLRVVPPHISEPWGKKPAILQSFAPFVPAFDHVLPKASKGVIRHLVKEIVH